MKVNTDFSYLAYRVRKENKMNGKKITEIAKRKIREGQNPLRVAKLLSVIYTARKYV